MKADDAGLWSFDAEIDDCSVIRCPECQAWSPLAAWTEGEVWCDDCGSHATLVCPRCKEGFDHVRGPTFAVSAPIGEGR